MSDPLWIPSPARIAASNLTRFAQHLEQAEGVCISEYNALHQWSVDHPERFWQAVWDFTGVLASTPATAVLGAATMPGADWFPGARLNFAENLLRFRDERPAIVQVNEAGERQTWTYAQLADNVRQLAGRFREWGVGHGDRVAALMPNRVEAVVTMLAATSVGAIYSSCSPDFGFNGVMDRFGQIAPKVFVAPDGVRYGGKTFNTLARVREVANAISAIEHIIVVPVVDTVPDVTDLQGAILWPQALKTNADALVFDALPFDHPLYILYSSGTTGVPKCIVHGAGGTLLQHAKELVLQSDLDRDDVLFYFTTCGWMMWNWLVSGLSVGCTVVLYDGSPGFPDLRVLWQMAETEGVTAFGTSPKFLSSVENAGIDPHAEFDLSALRTVLSTGAPLSVENFKWVYNHVSDDVQLASISGGTDIVSCFMLGSPWDPVFAGEIQKRGLGMAVEAWDETGVPVIGQKGELVCVKPFPSMPVCFWDDVSGERYRRAYFDHFPGIWRHGDYIEVTGRGGVIVYGRSDATLNPGGVRIGTAEIDRQVQVMDEVLDCIVVGQPYQDDVRVVLFVVLREGLPLTRDLVTKIKRQIRSNTTPRHVPAVVLAVPAIPRTLSGKKVEVAVTQIVSGKAVRRLSQSRSVGRFRQPS
jgi:acetoacetyl-CoA synthetase